MSTSDESSSNDPIFCFTSLFFFFVKKTLVQRKAHHGQYWNSERSAGHTVVKISRLDEAEGDGLIGLLYAGSSGQPEVNYHVKYARLSP